MSSDYEIQDQTMFNLFLKPTNTFEMVECPKPVVLSELTKYVRI